MSDTKNGLQEVIDAAKAYKKLVKKYGTTKQMGKVFKELFEKHPDVKGVAWSQFAPYFNDGEACVFSVYEPYATVDEVTQDVIDNTSGGYGISCEYDEESKDGARWYGENGDNDVSEDEQKKLDAFLKDFSDIMIEDLFEHAFGDDSFIIATRDGITIGEAEHE